METLGKTIVLSPHSLEARRIAGWLRTSGLGIVTTARTADEAIFILGRQPAGLLIIDESVPLVAEEQLLAHISEKNNGAIPVIVRLLSADQTEPCTARSVKCAAIARKPLRADEVVVCVGSAMQRPDLVGHMYRERDKAGEHLAAARRMQLALLPSQLELSDLQSKCGIGLAGLYRSGEAVGGDFWAAWPITEGRFAITLADFAGHGLSAALNTFRLHAILSEETLPRDSPVQMASALNARLHAMLPRGQYATMIYANVDARLKRVSWCSAGGPPPMFVSSAGRQDLNGCGLPLGVRPHTPYQINHVDLQNPGVICLFSDGLYESGLGAADVPRDAIADALVRPANLAADGKLAEAAAVGVSALESLRDRYACSDYSDDIMAVCIAIGQPAIGMLPAP